MERSDVVPHPAVQRVLELLVCPLYGLLRVISLATSNVISLSTSLGAMFALQK